MLKILSVIVGSFLFFGDFFRELKKILKSQWRTSLSGLVTAFLCLFFHNEYLSWVEITGDETYVTLSFIIKNGCLLALAFKYIYIPLKNPPKNEIPISGKLVESIDKTPPSKDRLDEVFDKLREKNELTTKTDQTLGGD